MGRLEGKVIVLVGGTSGIGLSAARAMLREGARLVAVGRGEEPAAAVAAELGANAFVFAADATEPDTPEQAIDEALERFGDFHGLYHVAGGSGRKMGDGALHEITDTGWEFTIDQNITSVFFANRASVRRFLQLGHGGSILNLSSVLAFAPAAHHFGTHAYAAAKGAVIAMTRAAAAYYAKLNIRLNVLAPALIETPMSQRALQDKAVREFSISKQPLDGGRIGQPSDLDGAAVYFLSDESRFVTGQILAVDGGWCVTDGQVAEQGS